MSDKRRRAHGEGAVYQRSDGLWVAALDLGWIDGKRRRKVAYGKTEQEALAKRDELKQRLRLGVDLSARSRTVAVWLREWLTEIKATDGTRPSTLRRYREVVETHLIPGLGREKLDRLTARQVQQFLGARRDKLAPATLIKVHGVLRVALSDAERMDLVPRNVAKAVRPARLGRQERRALTVDEAKAFISAIEGNRLEAFFLVAMSTGLRRGELLGLSWSSVDLAARVVVVDRALQRVEGELRFVAPKTFGSRRQVPLPLFAVRALEAHRARQNAERLAAGSSWTDHDLVFASTIGTPMEPRNVNRAFEALRARAGLEWLHLHDLRHAFATFLLDQGVEMRVVMELLGHSTIRLTADTYGHVLPSRVLGASDVFDRLFSEAG